MLWLHLIKLEEKIKKQMNRNKESLWDLWDTIKWNNIHIMGIPEGEEQKEKKESLLKKLMNENFPNLQREVAIQYMKFKYPQTRNRDFSLIRHTQNLMCNKTKGKSNNFMGVWTRPTCLSLEGFLGKQQAAVSYSGDISKVMDILGNINLYEFSLEADIQHGSLMPSPSCTK